MHVWTYIFVPQPTPLYFMDEIDAALDFRNVSIVANYIKDRTKNAQFIIISLRYVVPFLFWYVTRLCSSPYYRLGMTCLNLATASLVSIRPQIKPEVSERGIWLFNWTVELKRHISAGISIDNHSLHSTIPAPPPSTAAVWYNFIVSGPLLVSCCFPV